MSRIQKIHIVNFETIEDAWLEFDQRGAIVLKGYNDSGKSAIILALRVFLYDYRRREQVAFIRDYTSYARIVWYDEDGTIILRDILSTGQSYYNVYKDNFDNLIFTTKENGVCVPFDGVPEFVQNILDVGSYDKMHLNVGDDRDPILLGDTSGGDNYKFLSNQLHSDELSLASSLLNADKNAKQAHISEITSELNVLRKEYNSLFGVSEYLINELESMDKDIDSKQENMEYLDKVSKEVETYKNIKVLPRMYTIDKTRLADIWGILKNYEYLQKDTILPTLSTMDESRLKLLSLIVKSRMNLDNITILPRLNKIEDSRLKLLSSIIKNVTSMPQECIEGQISTVESDKLALLRSIEKNVGQYLELSVNIEQGKSEKEKILKSLEELEVELSKTQTRTIKCNNCGSVIPLDSDSVGTVG